MIAPRVRIGAGHWTRRLSLTRLTGLTRHYYTISSLRDNPRSTTHRYYYQCAAECERRGLNLNKILKG